MKIFKITKQNKTIYVSYESKIASLVNKVVNWKIKRELIKVGLLPKNYKSSQGQGKSIAAFMSNEDFELLKEIKGGQLE